MVLVGSAALAAKPVAVTFVDYAQCANGAPPGTSLACPDGWINGILQASNSHYSEDQVTPQRAELNVPSGAALTGHTMTFRYQARKGSAGVHAYDSLATWNFTQTAADRCQGLSASDCVGGAADTHPIPADPQVLAPFTAPATGVTSTHQLAGQVMTMFGGDITNISVPVHDCVAAGACNDPSVDDYATVTVTYNVASTPQKVQLLFGGHLAAGPGPRGWGAGLGASSISGGPYHIKWDLADGASIGNRDNQIMGSAILNFPTGIVTTPVPTTAVVGASTFLNDSAVLSGGTNPTGTITFKLFAPTDPTCAGTAAYTEAVTVNGNGSYSTNNTTVAATSVGTWQWTADYSGDGVNLPSTSACTAEPVTITKASPSILTTPNPGSGNIGDTLNDSATVSGGFSPSGTVTFKLFGPDDAGCDGTVLLEETVNLVGGVASTTSGFTTTTAGTYAWTAVYNGDANNNTAESGCTAEEVVIAKNSPTAATAQDLIPNDTLTLTGATSDAGGTVDFYLFAPGDTCSLANIANAAYTEEDVALVGNDEASTGNTGSGAGMYLATDEGTYLWLAIYSGDANNESVTSNCVEEFTIDNDTSP